MKTISHHRLDKELHGSDQDLVQHFNAITDIFIRFLTLGILYFTILCIELHSSDQDYSIISKQPKDLDCCLEFSGHMTQVTTKETTMDTAL